MWSNLASVLLRLMRPMNKHSEYQQKPGWEHVHRGKKLMLKHNDTDHASAFPSYTVMLRSYRSGELKVKLFSYLFLRKFSA